MGSSQKLHGLCEGAPHAALVSHASCSLPFALVPFSGCGSQLRGVLCEEQETGSCRRTVACRESLRSLEVEVPCLPAYAPLCTASCGCHCAGRL